jgi:hypothetical protein
MRLTRTSIAVGATMVLIAVGAWLIRVCPPASTEAHEAPIRTPSTRQVLQMRELLERTKSEPTCHLWDIPYEDTTIPLKRNPFKQAPATQAGQ